MEGLRVFARVRGFDLEGIKEKAEKIRQEANVLYMKEGEDLVNTAQELRKRRAELQKSRGTYIYGGVT